MSNNRSFSIREFVKQISFGVLGNAAYQILLFVIQNFWPVIVSVVIFRLSPVFAWLESSSTIKNDFLAVIFFVGLYGFFSYVRILISKILKPSIKRVEVKFEKTPRKWVAICKYDKNSLSWHINQPDVYCTNHNLKLEVSYDQLIDHNKILFSKCSECESENIQYYDGIPNWGFADRFRSFAKYH